MTKVLLIGAGGYVGAAVSPQLRNEFDLTTLDDGRWSSQPVDWAIDYAQLQPAQLRPFQVIVLLAGHSSPSLCQQHPDQARQNNVVAFQRLLAALRDEQRLIYASSASVYGRCADGRPRTEEEASPANLEPYDAHKREIEVLAAVSGKRCYGLRFGTVCGPSPAFRCDMLLNRMRWTAHCYGYVEAPGEDVPPVYRSVLGTQDAAQALAAVIREDGEPGVYNVVSDQTSAQNAGRLAAETFGVPLKTYPNATSYSMRLCADRFRKTYHFEPGQTVASLLQDLAGMDLRAFDPAWLRGQAAPEKSLPAGH